MGLKERVYFNWMLCLNSGTNALFKGTRVVKGVHQVANDSSLTSHSMNGLGLALNINPHLMHRVLGPRSKVTQVTLLPRISDTLV